MKCYLNIFVYCLVFVIFKKLISLFVYPMAYLFRHKVYRSKEANKDNWQLDKVRQYNKGIKFLIWLFLDDSIHSDYGKEYAQGKYPKILNYIKPQFLSEFLKSYWFSAVRNSSNNMSHYLSVGDLIKVIENKKYIWNRFTLYLYKRMYTKNNQVKVRCRIELFIKIGGKYCRIAGGWLKNGKYEGISLRCKDKIW